MQEISVPMHCPSFSSYSTIKFAEIADRVTTEFSDDKDQYGLHHHHHHHHKVDDHQENKRMETDDQIQSSNNYNNDEDDFEFAFVPTTDSASTCSFSISADQIFSNGVIKPIFPIFNRDIDHILNEKQETNSPPPPPPPPHQQPLKSSSSKRHPLGRLFIEEQDSSSSSSEADDLESVRPGTYCIWSPKRSSSSSHPDNTNAFSKKKSNSSGNDNIKAPPKRFRLMDLIRRSNSDVNETYVFLAPLLTSSSSSRSKKSKDDKVEAAVSMDAQRKMVSSGTTNAVKPKKPTKRLSGGESLSASPSVSSHEIHYLRNRALKEGDRRRSYLPYKRDLIGFFTNANGLNRKLYPFQAA